MTRNFVEEDMNIFRPRVDRRLDSDGVTGMQFPSYEYGAAIIAQLTGYNETGTRIYSLCLFSLAIVFFYGICFSLTQSSLAAAIGASSLCWSPELFYHGINALPDILALTAMLGGLFFYLRSEENKVNFLVAFLLITLAGLTKIQFASVLAFVCMHAWMQSKRQSTMRGMLPVVAASFFSSLCIIGWYVYANGLIEQSGLRDYGIMISQAAGLKEAASILYRNIVSNLPELLLGYATTVFFVIGLVQFFRRKSWRTTWFRPAIAWIVLLLIYHLVEIRLMEHHTYYMIVHIPLLMLLAVYGGLFLNERRSGRMLLVLLLIAQPIVAAARILPARWMSGNPAIPADFMDPASRKTLEAAIPPGLSIVGPDPSGCIYFYFLHTKGFGFDYPTQLTDTLATGRLRIDEYIQRGAKHLVTDHPELLQDALLLPYLDKPIHVTKGFWIIKLHSK